VHVCYHRVCAAGTQPRGHGTADALACCPRHQRNSLAELSF
jgi:hypothetical protein